jgi:hypothetical protein
MAGMCHRSERRLPDDWRGALTTVQTLASGWVCPSHLLEEMSACPPTVNARTTVRSHVGEEFRKFAHGVCKEDRDQLQVLEKRRDVVYKAAWESAQLQLRQRTNHHTTRKFWPDGPCVPARPIIAHPDTPNFVETGDEMGYWSTAFAPMAETGGSLKNIGPHPEISMHTPMVRKIPTYGLQQSWRAH